MTTASSATNPYHRLATPVRCDDAGNVLDASGAIIGALRRWTQDDRATRTAAIAACFDAIDGRAPLPATIGCDAMVTLCWVTERGCSAAMVLDVARRLDARAGYEGAAFTLRCRARHMAEAELAAATREAAVAKTEEATAARVVKAVRSMVGNAVRRTHVATIVVPPMAVTRVQDETAASTCPSEHYAYRCAMHVGHAVDAPRDRTVVLDDCCEEGADDGENTARSWGDL